MKFTAVVVFGLLGVIWAFPADENKQTETRLDRPSTEATPELSECSLDALLGEVFGSSGGNTNCNNNPSQPPSQPNPPNYEPDYEQNPNYVPDPPPQQPPFTPANPDGAPGTGEDCTCVQYYLCNDNNTINDNGVNLIDIRIKEDECNSYLEKCCGGTILDIPNLPPPPSQTPQIGSSCGNRNPEGIGFRITGNNDNEAQYGEFPWMVAVVRPLSSSEKSVSVYQCGGSLIHPRVVLTGAHCVQGKDDLVIRAGEWDTQTKNELYQTQDRKVARVIIHEQFNPGTLANDPALLILDSDVDMSVPSVGLICLPEANENMDGRNCVASGWGKDQFGKEGKYQVILKRVEMPTVDRSSCLSALQETRLGQRFKLHESFICAGGIPGKDTCKGDGGSPLVCPSRNNPNVFVQAGIVAWGIDCGTKTPGVYASVPYFVNWIYNKLEQQDITHDDLEQVARLPQENNRSSAKSVLGDRLKRNLRANTGKVERLGRKQEGTKEQEKMREEEEERIIEELKRREEEEIRRTEEIKRREEEEVRRAEELKRREDEEIRRAEELKRREEEEIRRTEELKRREEEETRISEELKRREDEEGRRTEELKRRKEEKGKRGEEQKRRSDEEGRRDQEQKRRENEKGRRDEELKRRGGEEGRRNEEEKRIEEEEENRGKEQKKMKSGEVKRNRDEIKEEELAREERGMSGDAVTEEKVATSKGRNEWIRNGRMRGWWIK